MRIEPRTDPAEFFALVEQRRDLANGSPLIVRERHRRGEWLVTAELELRPRRLMQRHMLSLTCTAGHLLGSDVSDAEAWPTHAAAIAQVRDLVRTIRRGATEAGLTCDVCLALTDLVRANRPSSASIAASAGRRLGHALAWCGGREVA